MRDVAAAASHSQEWEFELEEIIEDVLEDVPAGR